MRKKSAYVWLLMTALLMTACSDKDEITPSGETAELKFEIAFEATPGTRVPKNIPETKWSNIKQIQFFLYEGNTVKYSRIERISGTITGIQKYTYTDVPVGTYKLVAVANTDAATDNISSYISTTASTWNEFNVRSKNIADLYLKHKPSVFPAYAKPAGNTAFTAPSEVFMAYDSKVVIASGTTTKLNKPLKLKREVSMMRVILKTNDTDAGVNNTSTGAGGVDWTKNVSTLIYTLPDRVNLQEGNTGGVVATSTSTNILVSDGVYGKDGNVMYKEIIVFPNNGGRANNVASAAGNSINAPVDQKYFIVVSALGKAGHILADGTKIDKDQTVYWSGLIDKAFYPNTIREVTLTLKSGGEKTIPTVPKKQGTLIIDVDVPLQWDSNIQEVGMII